MKIEALEDFNHLGDKFIKGDVRTVPDADGKYFCSVGWAADVAKKVKTAERDVNRKVLYVEGAKSKTKAKEAN